ncbi:calcineurin-like phosphoesterase domain-containing protein [Ditylenchus destructor]|uniref:Calcineurin-like phosphoesterase domain-containing protein n=1 Tax=Ditylenchus destructor TaxID=166010 RepID=A0AAD4R2I2_9BILA|nr:calcineurin-like phosphoesterase domain-containing protein [Ditylenchus destructor]
MEIDALEVQIDPRSRDPTELWNRYLSKERICRPIPALSLDTPVRDDAVRFVCVSDTHEDLASLLASKLVPRRIANSVPQRYIPPGDVFVHCGDFTHIGEKAAVLKFNKQIGELPHKHKIVIAGNHEIGFEDSEDFAAKIERNFKRFTRYCDIQPELYKLLTNCTYLQNSFTEVYGIRIYGSPYQETKGWEFYRTRGESILEEWLKIPTYNSATPIDVLLTHSPPLGHNDIGYYSERLGCAELLNVVEKRVRPKFHVFGHIHENNGITTNDVTTFINASICNNDNKSVDSPIIFDIPLPEGQSKN